LQLVIIGKIERQRIKMGYMTKFGGPINSV
jgi:hypothetical protein